MLTISGKSLGSRRPLFADFSIPLPPDDTDGEGGPLTLRQLIARIVAAEVQNFQKRQEARRLDRVMTRAQIETAADTGRISPEARNLNHRVDVEDAVEVALQAFEDGLYLVIIDEMECRDLEQIVHLTSDSTITFVRLTFLAGA